MNTLCSHNPVSMNSEKSLQLVYFIEANLHEKTVKIIDFYYQGNTSIAMHAARGENPYNVI